MPSESPLPPEPLAGVDSPPAAIARRPVHPPFTHLPLGGLVFVGGFDIASAVVGAGKGWGRELYRSATFVLVGVCLSLALAIISGVVDRSHVATDGSSRRDKVNIHGVAMVVATVVSVVDLVVRLVRYPGADQTPGLVAALTGLAVVVVVVGGELGGRLVYRLGIGAAAGRALGPTVDSDV